MIDKIADSSKPLWKELSDLAIKKAVSTFVSESVKAVVEIWKTRHLKEMDAEFKERSKARKKDAADAKKKEEKDEKKDEADESGEDEENEEPEEEESEDENKNN